MVSWKKFKLETYKNTVFFDCRLQGNLCDFFGENVFDVAVDGDRSRRITIEVQVDHCRDLGRY